MRLHKKLVCFSGLATIISFIICLLLHYTFIGEEIEFWINICLAIFGSALLTTLTGFVSYFHERRMTLEWFMYHTKQLLHFLNKYSPEMPLKEKVEFYLDYYDFDKSAWDMDFGNIDFMLERITKSREYIYKEIYKPIAHFNNKVCAHVPNFRWYLDGSGRNDVVMKEFVDELETLLIDVKEYSIPSEDEFGNPRTITQIYQKSKLVAQIYKQFQNKYYEIMYGKRVVAKMDKMEEPSNDQNETGNA